MKIAGTGHRPKRLLEGSWSRNYFMSVIGLRDQIRDRLRELEPSVVYCGMALGFDTWLAEECVGLRIPFIAAVPCNGQDKLWGHSHRLKYAGLLKSAEDIHVVSPGPYESWKMMARNEWMLNQLSPGDDIVLACWDGSRGGGTASTIGKARKLGIDVINLYQR